MTAILVFLLFTNPTSQHRQKTCRSISVILSLSHTHTHTHTHT